MHGTICKAAPHAKLEPMEPWTSERSEAKVFIKPDHHQAFC
jgi:hypothetical protein